MSRDATFEKRLEDAAGEAQADARRAAGASVDTALHLEGSPSSQPEWFRGQPRVF